MIRRTAVFLLIVLAGAACAHRQTVEIAPAAELYERAVKLAEGGKFLWWKTDKCDEAIPAFQAVIDNYPFTQYAVNSKLGIADCYFEQGRWTDAVFHYRDFEKLHPSHADIWRVRFQVAQAYREQSLAYDRDTADAEQAYFYYQRTAMGESQYRDEAREQAQTMARRLAERLLYIGRFYERNDEQLSAVDRYEALLRAYPATPQAQDAYARASAIYTRLGEPGKIAGLPQPHAVPGRP